MTEPALKLPPIPRLPTEDELPCDDGEPMETGRHVQQMILLIETLRPWLDARPDGYCGGNMFLYFSEEHTRRQDFRGPDFYLALGVSKRERKSWVVWQEGKAPDLVIELLSESTARYDKTTKKAIYQDQVRIPEYFWYDPWNPEDFAGFTLTDGAYRPIAPDERGRLLSPVSGLALVRWTGEYEGVNTTWLRWATADGRLLSTKSERVEAATRKADDATRQAEEATRNAEDAARNAEDAARQAEAATRQADAEAQRARAAEAEVARLRALLAEKGE
jgi:Uma2 family endonuclease